MWLTGSPIVYMILKNLFGGEMRKVLSLIFMAVLILLVPVISWAEIKEGSLELSPFFGYCNASTSRDL